MNDDSPRPVRILAAADQVMRADAEQAFPNECCGFMYGYETDGERVIAEAAPVMNAKEGDQRRRFEISPLDYMKAEAYALKNQTSLLGVYHSHPQHPAIASEHDLKSALPFFSYVIYSVLDGRTANVRSWQLEEDGARFREENVVAASEIRQNTQTKA